MQFFDPGVALDPYPHYHHWRDQAPVFRDEGTGQWVISRHSDVMAALKDPQRFSSSAFAESDQATVALPLLSDDPPRHTQLRALVNRAFTTRSLKQIEADIDRLSLELAASIPGGVDVDVAEHFTIPLPVAVIAQMMDIPVERGDDFKRWSDALTGTSEAQDIEDRMPDVLAMAAFFSELIPQRRGGSGTDLISQVVNAEVDGEHMSDEDIAGFCMLLLIAGNETTTNLLSNLLNYAASHDGVWQQLRQQPETVDAAIEEILRYDAPVQFVYRTVTEDMTLHGQRLGAGDIAILLLGSGNRDPQYHDCPDQFRLDRVSNSHLTFGQGIHFCIGAPLGRMEARLALQALLARFSEVHHSQRQNERTHSHMLRGFHHLWLQFENA